MADSGTAPADSTRGGGDPPAPASAPGVDSLSLLSADSGPARSPDRSGSPAADPMAELTDTGEARHTAAGRGTEVAFDPLDSLTTPSVAEQVDDRPLAERYPHLDLPPDRDPGEGPGWAEGVGLDGKELVVYRDTAKATPITGIDNIARDADGVDVLWEDKSVISDWQPQRWTDRHIDRKVDNYIEAREHLPHYEGAELGFRFTEQLQDDPLRDAIVAAVERKAEETGVPIRIEWSTGEQVRFGG